MPIWVKWVSFVIILMTTLVVPLLLFEAESNALVERVIEWTDNQPFTTALVLVSALTADVFLPVPNGVINTVAGSLFGWAIGAIIIWCGLSLGCLVGYGAGKYAARPLAARLISEQDLAAAHDHAERLGAVTLVLTRTVPMFAEVTTMAAGVTGYPLAKFMLITSLANVGVAIVFAGIGSVATETESGWLAFAGAIVIPGVAWLVYRVFGRTRA